jgi:hypothetical protein
MAVDVVGACSAADEAAGPQGFFVVLSAVFAAYICIDTAIAALAVRRTRGGDAPGAAQTR